MLKPMDDNGKKRQQAMQKRLKKLGVDNPVVKRAVDNNKPRKDAYEEYEIVHDLVSAAYSEFAEGELSLKESMMNLAKAISSAASKMKGEANDDLDDI